MAKLIIDGKERELEDNSPIKDTCKEQGIAFGCEDGVCGTCMIEIEEGMENLSELNKKEKDLGLDGKYRLGCQCSIKSGLVKVKY